MMSFIPLHLDALHRSPQLLQWINTWSSALVQPLTPEGWYTDGHGLDYEASVGPSWEPRPAAQWVFLWALARAAAYAAVDELSLSRLKRPHLLHIFICPRLCTHMWWKKLFKVADVVLELPSGPRPEWSACMHEPLILALVLPFIPHPPCQLRQTPRLLELGGTVCRLWHHPGADVRCLLRELCDLPFTLASLPPSVVWTLLHPPSAGQVLSAQTHR
jgi:hypothetical protein